MRLAFESVDLEFFSKYGVWTRASCEPHILAVGCGSHVLHLAFGLQQCDFTAFRVLMLYSPFFAVRYSSNPLAKRRHFGHVGGPDSDAVSKLNKTVPAFTGKSQERRAKLSQANSQVLRSLIMDGRLESEEPDFLFGDFINEDGGDA